MTGFASSLIIRDRGREAGEILDLKTPVSLSRCMTFFSTFDQQLQRGEPCSSRLFVANGFGIDRVCITSHFVCFGDLRVHSFKHKPTGRPGEETV